MSDTTTLVPAVPSSDPPIIQTVNAIFDVVVTICPSDWADRQIRKAQGAVVAIIGKLSPVMPDSFTTDSLHDFIDGLLKAAAVALVGRPIAREAILIVRGILDAVWEELFPKVKPALVKAGVKVS